MSLAYQYDNPNTWDERVNYIPQNFTGKNTNLTAENIDSVQYFKENYKSKKVIPLLKIKADLKKYKTKKPIKLNLFEDDDLFFAESESLNIISYGETKEEAIYNFGLHVIHFVEFYKNKSELIGNAIEYKKLFPFLLIEI